MCLCCGVGNVNGGALRDMPSQLSHYLWINPDRLHKGLQGLGAQVTVMLCGEDGA